MKTVDRLLAHARNMLEEQGGLPLLLMVRGKPGPILVGLDAPKTAAERKRLLFLTGVMLYEMEPTSAYLVSDAYYLTAPDTDSLPPGSFADDPRAKECLMVSHRTRGGRAESIALPYEKQPRLEGDVYIYGEIMRMPGAQIFMLEAFFRGVETACQRAQQKK